MPKTKSTSARRDGRREKSLEDALRRLVDAFESIWGESTDYEQGQPNEAAYTIAVRILRRLAKKEQP